MKKIFLTLLFAFFSFLALYAQQERSYIRKGAKEFDDKKYVESEAQFKKALEANSNSFEAQFNMADALYKQEKYDEALKSFEALAAKETDKQRLALINHNIGNCHLTKKEIDKAISSYKSALKNNPLDNETRYNLIAAQKMKDEQQKQQQQQQQQQQQEQQQDKQEQQQDQQQMDKQDVERILQAMEQDEKDIQEKMKRARGKVKQNDKNW